MTNQSITCLLKRLWQHIDLRRRRQFRLLLALTLVAAFAETFSIGAILPFLAVLTSPKRVFESAFAEPIIYWLGISRPEQLLFPLALTFGLAAIVAGVMRLLLLWASTRLAFATGADLGVDIYRKTLYQPYSVHCSRNSSEIIGGITIKANGVIYNIILPFLNLISASVMLAAILITLLSIDPVAALLAFSGFGVIYIIIIRVTRRKLLVDSLCIARESVQVIKSLQEGLGGIRDVLIDGSQSVYCNIYRSADLKLRRAQGDSAFISISPRYAMEALGMVVVVLLAYLLAQQADGINKVIPILGSIALGAQRLLPVLQQAYSAWINIWSGQAGLQDTIDLLDQPIHNIETELRPPALEFRSKIKISGLNFRYSLQSPYVLKGINIVIDKGSRVGFIGTTGSGKSTLLDIVMGLLSPTDGTLEIDGQIITENNKRNWQSKIAHVPQTIYLADTTIEENIAFGIPKAQINTYKVRQVAEKAQLAASIESWPQQYQTFVGERGIRLSGGQRQRIGIARALYKEADVIIFDEATSALDNDTEEAVMRAIEGLSRDLTLLIVAHRLSTLKGCTKVIELAEGSVKRIGNYEDIIIKSEQE